MSIIGFNILALGKPGQIPLYTYLLSTPPTPNPLLSCHSQWQQCRHTWILFGPGFHVENYYRTRLHTVEHTLYSILYVYIMRSRATLTQISTFSTILNVRSVPELFNTFCTWFINRGIRFGYVIINWRLIRSHVTSCWLLIREDSFATLLVEKNSVVFLFLMSQDSHDTP